MSNRVINKTRIITLGYCLKLWRSYRKGRNCRTSTLTYRRTNVIWLHQKKGVHSMLLLISYGIYQKENLIENLCTRCLSQRYIPEDCNTANIILIHKKGSKEDIKNYRQISLLPIIYKILTKIIKNVI